MVQQGTPIRKSTMGSFGGFAMPGSIMILFGLWWLFQAYIRFYTAKRHRKQFRSTASYQCRCLGGVATKWPIEGMMKVLLVFIAIVVEFCHGYNRKTMLHAHTGQHVTMYFMFGLCGLVDCFLHLGVQLTYNTDYICLLMAFSIEALLFTTYSQFKTGLDLSLHHLLVLAVCGCIVSLLVEMRYRRSLLAVQARCFFVLVQGTWFWQIACVMYPYELEYDALPWNPTDHENILVASSAFAWHLGCNFIFICLSKAAVGYMDSHRETTGCVGSPHDDEDEEFAFDSFTEEEIKASHKDGYTSLNMLVDGTEEEITQ